MKIAFFVAAFPKLSETFILNQIIGLIDRGHEIDIYASSNPKEPKVHPEVIKYNLLSRTFYINKPNNKFIRIIKAVWLMLKNLHKEPFTIFRSLNVIKYGKDALSLTLLYSSVSFLNNKNYDIIHCHFGPMGNLAIKLMEIGAITGKIVTSFHGYDVHMWPSKFGRDIYDNLFEKGDLFTVNTDYTSSTVIALGCKENKIVKIPVGLKPDSFPFEEKRLLKGKKINILTVARLVEKKGVEYSIKAVSKVMKEFDNLRYYIVGNGNLRNKLEKLIEELHLSGKIKILGWKNKEEIKNLYKDSYIFILSSVTSKDGNMEGQGLVLQEAQACGLPVISTYHNGIPEGVLDKKSGFLVPERDVDALAEKLEYLINHPEVWGEMGKAGRKFVEEKYDINKLNDRLVEIYKKVINKKPFNKY